MEATALAPLAGPDRNGSAASGSQPEVSEVRERVATPVEVPREQRPSAATLGALAVAVGTAAVGMVVLALVLGLGESGAGTAAVDADARQAIGLLSKPSTERIPLERANGALVLAVGSGGRGALVLRDLEPAPSGSAYEAWVVDAAGGAPAPAAVFSGTEKAVLLSSPVPPGAMVGVTLESAVGTDSPTERMRFVATRARPG